MVLDEPHLSVHADVLVEVSDGLMRLGPEDRSHLVDAFEDTDHHLLVELGALCQIGLLSKVFDRENVGTGLRSRAYDLGRRHLGETLAVKDFPESVGGCGTQFEDGLFGRCSETDHGIIEERIQMGIDDRLVDRKRQRFGDRRQHCEGRVVHLVSAGSLWLCNHRALDLDDTLDKQSIDGGHCLGSLHDDLTDARAIAQVNKYLSLIHISEPTRLGMISYAVFCLKKK